MMATSATRRIAAPSPDRGTPENPRNALEKEIHELCVAWGEWERTRRFYDAPRPELFSALSQFLRVPGKEELPFDPECSENLALFHIAVTAWPETDLGRRCFESQYLRTKGSRKATAARIGISRATYYGKVTAFARSAYAWAKVVRETHMRQDSGKLVRQKAA